MINADQTVGQIAKNFPVCASWRALEDLELSLHEHIHLENNILFPRVSAA